jgi:hypothetical protein
MWIMSPLRILKGFAASKRAGAALPALLAGVFCFNNVWLPFRAGAIDIDFYQVGFGSFLLAGVRGNNNCTWMMPLFETIFSAALNFGISPVLFCVILSLAGYLLVFCVGCLLRGYWAGVLSLAVAGALGAAGTFSYDEEQSFYAFSLLLVLSLLILKRRDNTLKNSLLCGLALGASMLVRTPLVLFPPAVVLFDWFYSRDRSRAFILRSLALLAASYILLISWAFLGYSISGKFSLVDDRRAACNLITGAKGSIYTMEGDSRKLAGLGEDDSAFGFFAREVLRAPGPYALSVLRRLWHIFLFYPLLFGLFIIALAASRERDKLRIFGMPLYFILIHSALSIEGRYFYPMLYVLPPLIIGSFWPKPADQEAPGRCPAAEKIIAAAFWLFFPAVLAVEVLIAVYPYRAARNLNDREYLALAQERFPNDRVFQDIKCKLLWIKGDDAGYSDCLGSYSKKFSDRNGAYFLAVRESPFPSALPVTACRDRMECLVMRMLREFELGDQGAVMTSFRQAYAEYERSGNMLRGEPYRRDKELALLIKGNASAGWNEYVYRVLLRRPPKSVAKTISGLKKNMELPGRAKLNALKDVLYLGQAGERMARKLLASDMPGLPSGCLHFLWKKAEKESKELSDSAVEKIVSGDFKAAERLLLKAVELNPTNPEAFMNLCFVQLKENEKGKALEACQSAAYAVYLNPENRRPALETLAAEASFKSYELLEESGRKTEAGKTLSQTIENAPASWPGLPKARAALKTAFERSGRK